MRTLGLIAASLLAIPAMIALAPTASAGPSCGSPDEHINLVPTDIWYGGGGCYGVQTQSQPWCLSNFGVDRPYAKVWVRDCGVEAKVQP
jgi:hypothetical protein